MRGKFVEKEELQINLCLDASVSCVGLKVLPTYFLVSSLFTVMPWSLANNPFVANTHNAPHTFKF